MTDSGSLHLSMFPALTTCRIRRLPVPGEILVAPGDRVQESTVVARAQIAGGFQTVNAAAALGVTPARVGSVLTVKKGDSVKAGQLLGETRALMGLIRNRVFAPRDGIVEEISPITGQLVVAEPPTTLALPAYVNGEVVRTDSNTTVEISAEVSMVQGIFGIGGEAFGKLRCLDCGKKTTSVSEEISVQDKGAVLMLPGFLSGEVLQEMIQNRVAGVVAASASGRELSDIVGRPVNPAATGNETLGITVVLTEGFGRLDMAAPAFEILTRLSGKTVSLSGATQVRAGVIRPEVVGPPLRDIPDKPVSTRDSLRVGDTIRIVRGTAFGAVGAITSAPVDPKPILSGARALVFEVKLVNGDKLTVPRANVEWIGSIPDL